MKKRFINSRKRGFRIFIYLFFLLLVFSFVQAQEQTEEQKIDDAYSCLEDRVEDRCTALSTEQKAFSLLAINQCKEELIADSSNEECWPSGSCSLKTTAQSILALKNAKENTTSAQDWLISRSDVARDLKWYIQADSSEAATCTVEYSGSSYNFNLNEDKTLEINNGGSCISKSDNGYWLEISSSPLSCQDQEFIISCDKRFSTNLLFTKPDSSTIYVFPDFSKRDSGQTTETKIESSCFVQGGTCNYEGSLWAALVLKSLGKDISSYLPYLITFAEDNPRLLPDAFLFAITSNREYESSLLSKQKSNGFWSESNDNYYDTALALYPFQSDDSIQEKTNAKTWLLDNQNSDGCWQGNIRNTAFILESIWPRSDYVGTQPSNGATTPASCEGSGNYCVRPGQCSGDTFDDLSCPGSISSVCCSQPVETETCQNLIEKEGGEICLSNEVCRGEPAPNVQGLLLGQVCCVGASASCEPKLETSECVQEGGTCRISSASCFSDEEPTSYSCPFAGDTCCMPKDSTTTITNGEESSLMWVWILLALIVLVTVGIIFKDKLREFWLKIKSKFGGSRSREGHGYGGPRRPPGPPYSPHPRRHLSERRIIPRHHPQPSAPPTRPREKSKPSSELDEVLKKLKEMSN